MPAAGGGVQGASSVLTAAVRAPGGAAAVPAAGRAAAMPVAGEEVRGASAALTAAGGIAGGAAALLAACGGALGASTTRGVTRGLKGRGLEALAGDGGVGRDSVTVPPGSVAFGDGGNCDERDLSVNLVLVPGAGAPAAVGDRGSFGRRARQSPVESVRVGNGVR